MYRNAALIARIKEDFANAKQLGPKSTARLLDALERMAQDLDDLKEERRRGLEGYPGY